MILILFEICIVLAFVWIVWTKVIIPIYFPKKKDYTGWTPEEIEEDKRIQRELDNLNED